MDPKETTTPTRRQVLQVAGGVAAASALSGIKIPAVHAAGSEEIHVALVGCGGRGTGAAAQAMNTSKQGPIKLTAMADAFKDRLDSSYNGLSKDPGVGPQVEVPEDRRFIGWDAYKSAMDALKPGDIVILTTPPAFRWVQFTYAIQKGLNVFMEKPVTVDGPTSRRMLKLGEDATAKNLKVGVGLMSRHSNAMREIHDRVSNGEIGDIILMRGYRIHNPAADFERTPNMDPNMSDLDFQVRHFHAFLWASGGNYSDFYIHHIDHLSWMKNGWPVKAQGVGGRHYKTDLAGTKFVDQNFDAYAVEYTFADGSKFYFEGRHMPGTLGIYSSHIHGTKGSGTVSAANDVGFPSSLYKAQIQTPANVIWQSKDTSNPYQNEWDRLVDAIRKDKPYNEVKRGVEASVATSLGRAAAHTGQEITFDEMLNSDHEFAPGLDKLTKDSPAPITQDAMGYYPRPMPGQKGKREY